MAKLTNEITIDASREEVWEVLADLEVLDKYDPAVLHSQAISSHKSGIGASRKCDVRPKGWFKERITQWEPNHALAFELYECTLPIKSLKHSYSIEQVGDKTRVSQVMEYEMKFGSLGKIMDVLMVRKKWNEGIKRFFAGLKSYVEKRGQ